MTEQQLSSRYNTHMREQSRGPDDQKRKEAAHQIRRARWREREGRPYNRDRSGFQYIKELAGVKELFSYLKTLPSRKILDIGAGTTHGITDISQSSFGTDMEFEATVLNSVPQIEKYLGNERTHITSAEILRGIPDNSIACVLSVFSLTYSRAPELVIGSVDRVLVPGGVIKIGSDDAPIWQLYQLLKDKGYDTDEDEGWGTFRVVLGIKPGNPTAPSAASLIEKDKKTMSEQWGELIGI